MIYQNYWGSLVSFCNDILDEMRLAYPGIDMEYIDWEAHANKQELPDADLIGTTAVTLTEETKDIFSVSFTIGISTFADDKALFRLRDAVNRVFQRLRPTKKVGFYDAATAAQIDWIHITDGTLIMPMTKADVRPLQFVQCHGLIDPMSAVTGLD